MWGTGKFSKPNCEVNEAQEPDRITSLTVNDSGSVRFTWTAPGGNGSTIAQASYNVQILKKDGDRAVDDDWVTPNASDGCKKNDVTSIVQKADSEDLVCRL